MKVFLEINVQSNRCPICLLKKQFALLCLRSCRCLTICHYSDDGSIIQHRPWTSGRRHAELHNTHHTYERLSTQQSCVLRLWRASTQKSGTKSPLFGSYFTGPSYFHGPCPVKSPPAGGTNTQEVPTTSYAINKIDSSYIWLIPLRFLKL